MKNNNKFYLIIFFLVLLLVLTSLFAIFCGPAGNLLSGMNGLDRPTVKIVILQLRFPRIILAIVTGFALALSGVILQALLRNPLADPFVLGTSAGAATMAVFALVLGFSSGIVLLSAGFLGAFLSLMLVLAIAGIRGHYPIYRLIVAGIIVHSFFSAIMMIIISLCPDKISGVMLWLMGSLENKTPAMVILAGIIVLTGYIFVQVKSQELNLLSLGDDLAMTSGVNVTSVKLQLLVITGVITGVVVSLSGIIGFIGIIVPHGMRMILGANHKYLLLSSALGGALFLLISDTLVRLYLAGFGLPVGVVTTLAGAPFFIYLLYRNGRDV